ncbi:S1 family peptidase [Mobiluncus mulieris]|uniref:S1 family peptidase n=1 Tax=Mobiluncus mulieris TaxID=2052 RepID=UPI0021E25B11|nr:S1 family peptidase [Mobiluncus mulieris]MCV0009693.1 trypsin-like serine protease [Mobiluncus mulieris]
MRIIAIPLTLLMVLGVSVSSQAASNDEHRGLQRTGSCSFDPWLDNVPDHIRTIETGLYDYIKEDQGETFAFKKYNPQTDKTEIGIKGEAPQHIVKLLKESSCYIMSDNLEYSENDYASYIAQKIKFFNLLSGGEYSDSITASYDVKNAAITIQLPEGVLDHIQRTNDAIEESESQVVLNRTSDKSVNLRIRTVPNNEAAIVQKSLYGGGYIFSHISSEYISKCTSGFSVSAPGHPNSLLTAGHCVEGNYDARYGNAGNIRLEIGDHEYTKRGDVAVLYADGYDTAPQIWSNNTGTLINITWKIEPSIGQALAFSGQRTGRKVSKVRGKFCALSGRHKTDNNNPHCNFFALEDEITKKGDSGGPFFSSGGAAGVLSGATKIDGKRRDYFTPVSVAEKLLHITLKTM